MLRTLIIAMHVVVVEHRCKDVMCAIEYFQIAIHVNPTLVTIFQITSFRKPKSSLMQQKPILDSCPCNMIMGAYVWPLK